MSKPNPPVVDELTKMVDGLLMPSETDAPFRVFYTPEEKEEPTPADYAHMAGVEIHEGAKPEERSLEDLLGDLAEEEDWMNDEEKAQARKFGDLRAFLNANLSEIEVYAWGKAEKQVVIVGRLDGGFAGLVTTVVET